MDPHNITFGTDGWHAAMDDSFTDKNVVRIAHAFARFCRQSAGDAPISIAIAFDTRRNSRRYASLVADVLSSYGCTVLLSDRVVPTPVLSFAVKQRACAGGVMITGNCNPPEYNGIKFKASYGGPFTSDETKKVEAFLRADEEPFAAQPQNIRMCEFLPDYIAQLKRLVDFDALRTFASASGDHAAVMIDSMGGAGQTLIEDLLSDYGWRAQTLFGSPDERFYGRTPEPIARNLEPLMYNVSVTDALLGIATDGDAGRCGIVYGSGEFMSPQETILAIVTHLRDRKHWTGSVEGGGCFVYERHIPDCDGILMGLLFAEMIALSGKPLRSILDEIREKTASGGAERGLAFL